MVDLVCPVGHESRELFWLLIGRLGLSSRLEDGLGRLGRRFEGELRNIHERLDQQDDGARGTRKRVKYDLLREEDIKKE